MMVLKRKTIIIVTLVLLIVAAGYISTKYGKIIKVNNGKEEPAQTEVASDKDAAVTNNKVAAGYFVDIKLGRENERIANKQTLTEVINNSNTSKEAKKNAEEQLLNIVKFSEEEMKLEALVMAQGFDNALVFLDETSANVTVKSKEVNAEQVNKIKNIVCKATGINPSKVTIQSRE